MKKIKVEVCMGTACFVMGSGNLFRFIESLSEAGDGRVSLEPSLCCDLCRDWANSKPPIVRVGESVVHSADEERVQRAIEKALRDGVYAE